MRASACLVLVAACGLLASCDQRVDELRLVAPALPVDESIAELLAERIGTLSGLKVEVVRLPDGMSSLEALESGFADLAFEANTHPFHEGISTVMPLYPTVLHIVVSKDRIGNDPVGMLEGATVYAGPPDSASRVQVERVMEFLGLGENRVQFATDRDEPVDIIVVYAPINPERLRQDSQFADMELYSFGEPGDVGKGTAIDRAILLNPRVRPFVIPAGIYGDITPRPVLTLAVDQLLVARSSLPSTTVYDLIGEIMLLAPVLADDRPEIFERLDGDFDLGGWAFALHPGAVAYLQRDEPGFVERYSNVAELLVTLLLAALSGILAAVKIYRIRRKNRIDVFYKEVMRIRDAVGRQAEGGRREDAIKEIRRLQNSAFEQLVDERLAADESFRIFITLADDAIRELREEPQR